MTNISAEVTPHHLTLTDEAILGRNSRRHKRLRSIRPSYSRSLRHASQGQSTPARADRHGRDDRGLTRRHDRPDSHRPRAAQPPPTKNAPFHEAAFGISTLETALGQLMSLVHSGAIDLPLLIEKLTLAPARFLRRDDLGTLKQGAPADITIIDPDTEWTVDTTKFASKGQEHPTPRRNPERPRLCYGGSGQGRVSMLISQVHELSSKQNPRNSGVSS